jgi:hypothetical protein
MHMRCKGQANWPVGLCHAALHCGRARPGATGKPSPTEPDGPGPGSVPRGPRRFAMGSVTALK